MSTMTEKLQVTKQGSGYQISNGLISVSCGKGEDLPRVVDWLDSIRRDHSRATISFVPPPLEDKGLVYQADTGKKVTRFQMIQTAIKDAGRPLSVAEIIAFLHLDKDEYYPSISSCCYQMFSKSLLVRQKRKGVYVYDLKPTNDLKLA